VRKSGVLEHKSGNISETRKDKRKSYYGRPVGNHQRSFERYHCRPPMATPSPRLGVHNSNPKLQSLLSQERVLKLRTFTGSVRTKVREKFGRKGSVGLSNDCPNFLSIPYYLRKG